MFAYDGVQGVAKLPPRLRVFVMNPGSGVPPELGDLANRQALLKAQAQDFDAPHRLGTGRSREVGLKPPGLAQDRGRPGAIELRGQRALPRGRVVFMAKALAALRPRPLDALRNVPHHAAQKRAESARPSRVGAPQRPVLAKAIQKDLLDGILDLTNERGPAPPRRKTGPDHLRIATGEFRPIRGSS